MTDERRCMICKSEIEQENRTNICFSCHSIIENIETKVDEFNPIESIKK